MKTSELETHNFYERSCVKGIKNKYPGLVEQLNKVAEFKKPKITLDATSGSFFV